MSIEFHCSQCGRLLRTGDDTVGRMAQCPQCNAHTQVPIPESSAPSQSTPPSGGGDSFDARAEQPAASTGYRPPYQTLSTNDPGQGGQGNAMYALQRVSAPAVCLIITAVLGLGLHALGLLVNMLNLGAMAAANPRNAMPVVFSGPLYIVSGSIGIILSIIVLVGAMKMKGLENYGFAMAASIIALFPCIGPCCLIGWPFGIWALVILSDPVVKASFRN
jgi:hypothetical protein